MCECNLRVTYSRCLDCHELMVVDDDTQVVYCDCAGFQHTHEEPLIIIELEEPF